MSSPLLISVPVRKLMRTICPRRFNLAWSNFSIPMPINWNSQFSTVLRAMRSMHPFNNKLDRTKIAAVQRIEARYPNPFMVVRGCLFMIHL